MLKLTSNWSLNSAKYLFMTGLIKRHSSLTIQTLNPLVKEVEYAVRGKQTNKSALLIDSILEFCI